MFITGPAVVQAVTGEDVTQEQLGGAMTHNGTSGVAHFAAENDSDCLRQIRYLLSFLPSNNLEAAPVVDTGDAPTADRRPDEYPAAGQFQSGLRYENRYHINC